MLMSVFTTTVNQKPFGLFVWSPAGRTGTGVFVLGEGGEAGDAGGGTEATQQQSQHQPGELVLHTCPNLITTRM